MATGNTNFGNDSNTGTVGADGFLGPLTGAVTGAVTNGTIAGTFGSPPTTYAAIGAAQGSATQIGSVYTVIVTATTSAQGVKLPTAATGRLLMVFTTGTKAPKLYPFTNDRIGTAATNVAIQLTANKGGIFYAKDAVTWLDILGA